MNRKSIQDLLPFVEQPSRYLGTEINSIHKAEADVKLRIALAFPDLYEIGTSHFGLQILYGILNSCNHIQAERVYAPGTDLENRLRAAELPLTSLESGRPLAEFDIIGFSLLYELNYTNMLTMLDLSRIPFYAAERDGSFPLIIAGGACMCNPEPVADFFDAIVIGDGEEAIIRLTDAWSAWKQGGISDKALLLQAWAKIEGVYIPGFFRSAPQLFAPPLPLHEGYQRITKTIVADLNQSPFPRKPVVSFGRPVHDRLRLEIARGCSRGCRFCQAGMIYRPVRERSPQSLLQIAEESLAATGYEDISLLSLSAGDYSCISGVMERLVARFAPEHVAISFPSLRAGALTPELMTLIKRVRKTGFTIAPEAGSQRLRDVINKNITEKEITDSVENAFRLGWQVLKLYFMIGLPTETDEDIDAIVQLVNRLSKRKPKGRKGKINVSIGVFVPKPHTPFQWMAQISLDLALSRIRELKDRLALPGVNVKWQKPEVSLLEGLFSRGDRRLSRLLVTAYRNGCRFDGWTDKFSFDRWIAALETEGLQIADYIGVDHDPEASLPWDHINMRISKDFLRSEWKKALQAEMTEDCRYGNCAGCGCCDFEVIKPVLFDPNEMVENRPPYSPTAQERKKSEEKSWAVVYAKMGQAAYFGHLELVSSIIRALRRAQIPVAYSEGFHPLPEISFQDPLPVGMESRGEKFFLNLTKAIRGDDLIERLNRQLPTGLTVLECLPSPPRSLRRLPETIEYEVILKEEYFNVDYLRDFIESARFEYTRTSYKGKVKSIDLKQLVLMIRIEGHMALRMTLKSEIGKTVRPAEVIEKIFHFDAAVIKQAQIIKLDRGLP